MYFSPSNLLQLRPRLEYSSHIWGAAVYTRCSPEKGNPTHRDSALTCRLQPLSHRRAVGDLPLFYQYSNGFCSSEMTSIIPPFSKLSRCTRGTSSSHPRAVVFHTSRTERYDRTFVARCPEPGIDCLAMYLLSRRVLAYSGPASTNFP
nr:unnamed protein product [Callosobruchus chinensis]